MVDFCQKLILTEVNFSCSVFAFENSCASDCGNMVIFSKTHWGGGNKLICFLLQRIVIYRYVVLPEIAATFNHGANYEKLMEITRNHRRHSWKRYALCGLLNL